MIMKPGPDLRMLGIEKKIGGTLVELWGSIYILVQCNYAQILRT